MYVDMVGIHDVLKEWAHEHEAGHCMDVVTKIEVIEGNGAKNEVKAQHDKVQTCSQYE